MEEISTTSHRSDDGMAVRLSLRRNFSWTFAGNVINAVSQFGMLLVLAHLGTAEMVGQYGLSLAITTPLFLLVNMSLRSVQVTDVQDEYSFSEYAVLRLISVVTGLVALVALLSALPYPWETAAVVFLVGLSKAIEGISDIVYGFFQKHEQMDRIAKSMIVRGVSALLVLATVLSLTGNLMLGAAAISAIWLIRLIAYDVPSLINMKGRYLIPRELVQDLLHTLTRTANNQRTLLSLLVVSLPMGLASTLVSLNTNIPRYAIEWSEGVASLGVFTVLAYPLVAGNTVMSALTQASLPRLTRYHTNKAKKDFIDLSFKMLVLGGVFGVIAVLISVFVGEDLIRIAFGELYAAEHRVFVVLVIAMGIGFLNWVLNTGLQAMRAFRALLVIQILVTCGTLLAAVAIVPRYGIAGAAGIVVASATVQILAKAWMIWREYR
jgi:O-antigen/teichoic acid export membrane protein